MARTIKTLEAIVADIRYETKRSANRNFGIAEYDSIKYLAQREQRRLWWEYNWSFLKVRSTLPLVAGQRYYDVPAGISYERITKAKTKFGSEWIDLSSGIDMVDYSIYDSDEDSRADPAMKWDIITVDGVMQMEIWPLPQTDGFARFDGTGELGPFISDDQNCTLDAMLITLFAAAKLKPEEQELLAAANRLLTKMRGADGRLTPGNKFSMAGQPPPVPRQARRVIAVHDA